MARIAVIGGGIAGRCVAAALGDVDLYDDSAPRASDLSAAIFHRFPGRTFDPPQHQSDAYNRTVAWFQKYPLGCQSIRIRRKSNDRLLSSLARIAAGVEVEVSAEHVEYGGAWVVDLPLWLSQLAPDAVVKPLRASVTTDGGLRVITALGSQAYDQVVVCPGASLHEWLPSPDIRVVHGEIAFFEGQVARAEFASAHAYPAQERVAVGHTFLDAPRSDAEALQELTRRALKDGHTLGKNLSVWRGSRAVVHPDRLPVLTEIQANLFVLGGLGAKGLLYSPYLAESLAARIQSGQALPAEFQWPRLAPKGACEASKPTRSCRECAGCD